MSQKLFDKVKLTKPQRSRFDLSHDVKMSAKFGQLIPIMVTPVVPGDSFNIGCESMVRFAPMIAPVMHRLDVTMHYFFVPYRILWDNWEKYISNTKDEITQELPPHPTIEILADGSNYGKLLDYMGVPDPSQTTASANELISPMALAAYQCVYNEYYRDQNLIDPIDYKLTDGSNDANFTNLATIRKRAWGHDYFTSALPFAQKGDPVSIGQGDVVLKDTPLSAQNVVDINGDPITGSDLVTDGSGVLNANTGGFPPNVDAIIDPSGNYVTNMVNINDLRIAYRVQEWLERSARGGTRYNEFIMAQFGVRTSDARIQRPEYITGIKTPVVVSEVLNTTGTIDLPQGNMAGHGVAVTQGRYGKYYSEEFGVIIGIMSVMPLTAYQQGMPKHFTKVTDPTEHYFPVFANLGEQEILQKEIMAFGSGGDATFGYIPRYAEYKYENNRVAGDFRTSLNFWHMGRILPTNVALNQNFIECDATTRIFAVEDDTDYLWCHVYNKVSASRLMPFYGTPMGL